VQLISIRNVDVNASSIVFDSFPFLFFLALLMPENLNDNDNENDIVPLEEVDVVLLCPTIFSSCFFLFLFF
jgi:hypothetical protein